MHPPRLAAGVARCYIFPMSFTLHDLEKRVADRAAANAEVSYTRKLMDRGTAHCAKKLGGEAADLLYHLLVVLHMRDIRLAEVEEALAQRTRRSGLDEKASRKGD